MKLLIPMLVTLTLAAGIPPLTEVQRQVLQTANDGSFTTDEAALYPLLSNALQWEPGVEAGAAIPDYAAITADPAAHRGQLYLVEGVFNGKPRSRADLSLRVARPGPWDDKLQEWYVVTDRAAEQVAVVYMVAPATSAAAPPAAGTKVRIPARFFKTYRAQTVQAESDGELEPQTFLVFVGHSPSQIEQSDQGVGAATYLVPTLLLVMIALAGYYALKRKKVALAAQPLSARVRRERHEQMDEDATDDEDAAPSLPKNPADALDALSRRHDAE